MFIGLIRVVDDYQDSEIEATAIVRVDTAITSILVGTI